MLRSVEMGIRTVRGETEEALAAVDELLDSARRNGSDDAILQAQPLAAAALLVGGRAEKACDLLNELVVLPGSRANMNYAMRLPLMVRTALGAGDGEVAQRLTEGFEPDYPLREYALLTARAAVTEADDDFAAAAGLYGEAAGNWRRFGHLAEEAESLLGQGRCLLALDDPSAEQPLSRSRELFASMGCGPALAETDALLERTTAAAS